MKRVLWCLVLVSLVGFAMVGCPAGDGEPTPMEQMPMAHQLAPEGTDVLEPSQMFCYVCQGVPLKAEHYWDFHGKRVFFDKAECIDKFKEDPEGYLRKAQVPDALWR